MNKKIIEYLIIATVVALLVYGAYSMIGYKYHDTEEDVTDSINMYYPASSGYTVDGDSVQFRNPSYSYYDMDVSKLDSDDEKVTSLLNHYANVNQGSVTYKNETCYLVTVEYEDGSGFKYHSMIIPFDSFNKESLSFTKDSKVYLFEGNDENLVVYSALNSKVVL